MLRWLKRILLIFVALVVVLLIVYLSGPRARFPDFDAKPVTLPLSLSDLAEYIATQEDTVAHLKPDNEARIVWADSSRQRTPYSLVYLPGFSGSHYEGAPLHTEFAERYGMNAYLARIVDHGVDDKHSFQDLTPGALVASAKEAIAIGKLLGERVILMSTSTGGTYSTYLAGDDPAIAGLIMYSPNYAVYDTRATLMTGPWGYQILQKLSGGDYRRGYHPEVGALDYWTEEYHIDGLIALQALLDEVNRPEVFARVTQPVLVGYYYKNEEEQDKVISIEAIQAAFAELGTPDEQKRLQAFATVGNHVLVSPMKSQDLPVVRDATYAFAEEVLGLRPVTALPGPAPDPR